MKGVFILIALLLSSSKCKNFSARVLKGKVQTFLWDFGDGALCKGQRCTHTYEDPGVYIVKLTVVNAPDNLVTKRMAIFIKEKGREKY